MLENILRVAGTVVEACGAAIICFGAAMAFGRYLLLFTKIRSSPDFLRIRLGLGRHLILGLEFQLAADLLRSAVSPTFYDIGQLAAIAAIRTLLNFFLAREVEQARASKAADRGSNAGILFR